MIRNRNLVGILSLVLLLAHGFLSPARGDETPRPQFVDVTSQSGILFQHSFGDDDMTNIVESTGSGCAFLDYDGDGYLDIYVTNGCYRTDVNDPGAEVSDLTNHLWHNNGDGTFSDVTGAAGVGDRGYGMGCVVGDYDNDGDPDLYVTNYGPNVLYSNNGDGTFSDVSNEAGVADTLWGTGATFFDYDNDGDLDLYVGNYLDFDAQYRLYFAADEFPGPLAYPGQRDALYRNNGDGTFAEVTESAGILNEGRAMGVLSSDYDNDGYPDVFVANDAMENYMYRNRGDGTFEEIGYESGVAFSEHGEAASSMGGDFADFDRDGDLDLVVPDMTFNSFYMNLGNGYFRDVSVGIGLAEISGQYWSWGGDFFDYDNDGDLDIMISNGDGHRLDTQEELFLANVPGEGGARVFEDAGGQAGEFFRHKSVTRGLIVGDYDNDGDLDVFLLNLDQPSILLRNDGGNRNHWLMIRLQGTRSNRDGVGARVTVRAGDLTQCEEHKTATSYLSQNDPRLHFGLGDRAHVDEVTVRWPSGVIQKLTDVPSDTVITVVETAP